MKIGIIIGIFLGMVLLGGAIVAVFFLGFRSESQTTSVSASTSIPVNTGSNPATRSSPTSASSPLSSAASSPSPKASTASAAVNFVPSITSISGSSFNSRTITVQLANTGTADAHNVQAKVEVLSQGTIIQVNGQPYLTQSLGTIKAGASVTIQYTASVSLTDGLKILQNGATINLYISSDEKTQSTSYDYQP